MIFIPVIASIASAMTATATATVSVSVSASEIAAIGVATAKIITAVKSKKTSEKHKNSHKR